MVGSTRNKGSLDTPQWSSSRHASSGTAIVANNQIAVPKEEDTRQEDPENRTFVVPAFTGC